MPVLSIIRGLLIVSNDINNNVRLMYLLTVQ